MSRVLRLLAEDELLGGGEKGSKVLAVCDIARGPGTGEARRGIGEETGPSFDAESPLLGRSVAEAGGVGSCRPDATRELEREDSRE